MTGDHREQQWFHQSLSLPVAEGMMPVYWPVCKFDLILAIPAVLTSITTCHLPLFNA